MYNRRIFSELEAPLSNKLVTVITGMRRVGKTTAVRYLLEKEGHRLFQTGMFLKFKDLTR